MRAAGELAFPGGTSIPLPATTREGMRGYEMTSDDSTKAAVIYMLERGLASYQELAELSGRSRQIIAHWAKQYPNARADFLAKKWQKALLTTDKNR